MQTSSVFLNNGNQAARLPTETRFPEGAIIGVNDRYIAGHARSEWGSVGQ
jgi:virulence-associated protein VagC